jgi:long-chain acyl-CoA synthetase
MAKEAGTLRRFDYVGTAYVAGSRAGLVREDELVLDQPFHNTYERTKAESERAVRDAADSLPVTIFRPSIVVGDSRTGVTQSFNVMYWPLKVFARGLVLCIPADPQGHVDIVPIDYVTDAIEWISTHQEPSGRCYHLAAGPGHSVTVDSLAQEAARFFDVRLPPYVSPKTFNTILKPIFKVALWGQYRRVYDVGQQYIPYLAYRAIFDTTATRAALAGSGIEPRSVRGYFHVLLNYCRASEWGKKDVAPQEIERLVAAME